jgi:hypothetical protein
MDHRLMLTMEATSACLSAVGRGSNTIRLPAVQ